VLAGAAPALHALTLTAAVGGADVDAVTKRAGVREARGALVAGGARGLSVNGVPVLVRGGGWAPDLLLRESAERTRAELAYVRDMGLNAVRLEGKMMSDDFFAAADVGAGPARRVAGHREPATALDVDAATGAVFTGCAGGRVCVWTPADEARRPE
jgi:hypothetical protein